MPLLVSSSLMGSLTTVPWQTPRVGDIVALRRRPWQWRWSP